MVSTRSSSRPSQATKPVPDETPSRPRTNRRRARTPRTANVTQKAEDNKGEEKERMEGVSEAESDVVVVAMGGTVRRLHEEEEFNHSGRSGEEHKVRGVGADVKKNDMGSNEELKDEVSGGRQDMESAGRTKGKGDNNAAGRPKDSNLVESEGKDSDALQGGRQSEDIVDNCEDLGNDENQNRGGEREDECVRNMNDGNRGDEDGEEDGAKDGDKDGEADEERGEEPENNGMVKNVKDEEAKDEAKKEPKQTLDGEMGKRRKGDKNEAEKTGAKIRREVQAVVRGGRSQKPISDQQKQANHELEQGHTREAKSPEKGKPTSTTSTLEINLQPTNGDDLEPKPSSTFNSEELQEPSPRPEILSVVEQESDVDMDTAELAKVDPQESLAEEHVEPVLVDVMKFVENTAKFLGRDEDISRQCRRIISQTFCEQSKVEFGEEVHKLRVVPQKREKGLPPLGPVLQLDVGQYVDCDQLWEQLEMRNMPLLVFLQRRVKSLQKNDRKKQQEEDVQSGAKRDDSKENRKSSDGKADAMEVDEVPISLGETVKGLLVDGDDENEDNAKAAGRDMALEMGAELGDKGTRKVRFAPETNGDVSLGNPFANGQDTSVEKSPTDFDAVEDGFFSLKDMEMFADDAEQLANQGKLVASDDEDSDEGEESAAEEGSPAVDFLKNNKPDAKETERLRYSDFFDPPAKNMSENVSNILRATGSEDHDDESEEATPLHAARSRTRKLIEAMEEENVAKKPWQLRGEVAAFSRPKDSLLNAQMDYDTAASSKSVMDGDRNGTIEDLIRQRIADGLFDDVVCPLPETYEAEKEKKANGPPEVSQEKPKESLAELYEKEFLTEKEKAKNNMKSQEVRKVRSKDKEVEETDEQKEVNQLFDKVASKLDALSGLHFTPGPMKAAPEMTVSGDIKALASEEAIPEAVSEENLRTPREVYSVDKKKLTGEIEKTKQDRRTAHRRNKRGIKKSNEVKARAASLMEKANPALAEKRRAEEAFRRRGKKIRLGQPDSQVTGAKLGNSGKPNHAKNRTKASGSGR